MSSAQYKVPINHRGRQVKTSDFTTFTHILAADGSNLRNLMRKKPDDASAEVRLWGSYLDGKPIADPYYDDMVTDNTSYASTVLYSHLRMRLRSAMNNALNSPMLSWIIWKGAKRGLKSRHQNTSSERDCLPMHYSSSLEG